MGAARRWAGFGVRLTTGLIGIVAIGAGACPTAVGPSVGVASVTVAPPSPTIKVDSSLQLTATAWDTAGHALATSSFSWTTGAATIARVNGSGVVVGVAPGTATITAASGGKSGSATVTVTGASGGQTLFAEGFDDAALANRGWYDLSNPVVTTAQKHSGTGSLQVNWTTGAQAPIGGMRKLFAETDRLYVSYWVKYSSNYVGSGQSYHPHEFNILSNREADFDGLTLNYLNLYIEQNYQNGGIPRLAIQDSRMIDITKIGVNLTGVTENRSVAGCNGNTDGTGATSCYQVSATEWYNAKTWDAAAVGFQPNPGADYKGDWNHVEVYFQLNTIVGGIGQSNGIARYWLNGQLKIELTNVLFRTGANPTLTFHQFFIGPYIGDGSPVTQTMWIDDLLVATQKP